MTNVVHNRNGGVWTVLSGEVRGAGPPGAPVVTLSPSDGQIVISWTAPFDGGSIITGYTVNKTISGTNTHDSQAANVFTDTVTIDNGTQLTVTVTATNAIGSTTSASVSATASASTEGSGYTIPAGFMTLATVGPNAADAPGGPKTRAQSSYLSAGLTVNKANQTIVGGYYKTLTLSNSVTMLQGIYVDNNSTPATLEAQIMVDGGSGSGNNKILILGTVSGDISHAPLASNTCPLYNVPPTDLNKTTQIEIVYFACSGLDSNQMPIYAAPTLVSGGWQYQIYNPSTSDNGFAYPHAQGRMPYLPGSTGYAVRDFGKPAAFPAMWMIATFCQFGNPDGGNDKQAGGGIAAIDGQIGTLYSRCAIGFNGDASKVAGRTWFDNCVIGPNLAPSSDPGYHSDGFQVVGGINNDPTGSTWLDLNHPLGTNGNSIYGYATSQIDSNTLHVFGTSWTVAYHCTHIGFSTYVGSSGIIKYIHAPFFLASNAGDPGEVQNLLVDSGFITGGFNMILDDTSVNSISPANVKNFNTGVGGDKGFIFRRNTIEFIEAGQGATQATLSQTANSGDTTLIVTIVGSLTSPGTVVLTGSVPSQNETLFVIDGPVPMSNSSYFSITVTSDLSNTANATDANAVGIVYTHANGAAVHGTSMWKTAASNGGPLYCPDGSVANGFGPNVAKTYNPSAGSPGVILSTTTYNYHIIQNVTGGATVMRLSLIQATAITTIPIGEKFQVVDGSNTENVITTGASSYDSNTDLITVPIGGFAHNHTASNSAPLVVKSNDITNWIEVPAGFEYSTADPRRNYWELSNVRSDTGAVITLAQAQWTVSQWLGQ